MLSEVLAPDDAAWAAFLERVDHDTYHLPGYVAVDARRQAGEPVAIWIEDGDRQLLLPLILRQLPHGVEGKDAISPYGYPVPLITEAGVEDGDFVAAAGIVFRALLEELQCACAFIRCHPLLRCPEDLFKTGGRLRHLGSTVWIDLQLSEEARWSEMSRGCRRAINATALAGYEVELDESWAHLDEFIALYRRTMDRVGAAQSYYFDSGYFEQLRRGLPGQVHLVMVRRHSHIVGAGVFLEESGIVQSHLTGSEHLDAGCSADRLLIDRAAAWFAKRGNWALHIGGGRGSAADSLFQFKSGFSPRRGSYCVWELVADRALFDLANEAAARHRRLVEPDSSFFPPYRAT